jgi:nitroreductase
VKRTLKLWLKNRPGIWSVYWRVKQEFLRLAAMRYFLYDIRNVYRSMFWNAQADDKKTLAAELIFQYHKLEKGMCIPGPKRLFGLDPAAAVIKILERWSVAGHAESDPVFKGAIATLEGYVRHLQRYELDPKGNVLPTVLAFLNVRSGLENEFRTPIQLPRVDSSVDLEGFMRLAHARRSVRSFATTPVPRSIIESAVTLAQLAPSACNRQPCRVYLLTDDALKASALSFQNGNRGFGHLAPVILIITADEQCFFDASERAQPYIDGGLFSMSLCYALTSAGLASCCLNWCVPPSNDIAVHSLIEIPESERIIMMMAVGYPSDDCIVPRSPRRALSEVLRG